MHIEPKMKIRYCPEPYIDHYGMRQGDWIEAINTAFLSVPEEYREGSCLSLSADDIHWSLVYQSPETPEEMEGARQRQMFIEAQEKEQLRLLKEKYGDS